MMKKAATGLIATGLLCGTALGASTVPQQKNVLFISVDDVRDWISPMGGYPGAITPNMQRFAEEGLTFTRAYTPAPWCSPSRTALLTGIRPSSSGVYHHRHDKWRDSPRLKDVSTLPQYFREHGYWTVGAGKIFHHANASQDPRSWDEYYPDLNTCMVWDEPPEGPLPACGLKIRNVFDWAPLERPKEEMEDWKAADHVIQQLEKARTQDKPFFIACGIYKPHLPWYAPKEYFDLYPLDQIQVPETIENDLDDVPAIGKQFALIAGANEKIVKAGLVKNAIQAYLASLSFADDCVGRVLDALDQSPFKDNTIVVIWSDHGWQHGEKEHWGKVTLWDLSCRTILQIRAPGTTAPGSRCDDVVSLMDLYPTLVSLCGLPPNSELEGIDITALLTEPETPIHPPVLSTLGPGNHSVVTRRWHYICYSDGGEELYDLENDPKEWTNLALQPEHTATKKQLSRHIPATDAEPLFDLKLKGRPF